MKIKYMNYNTLLLACLVFLSANAFSQVNKEIKIDGIAAIVGDEIVLDSDVERDYVYAKSQGMEITDKCEFLNNMLMEKMILDKAKQDTLIKITDDEVTRQVNGQIEDYLSKIGSEEALVHYFGMTTMAELKNELQYIVRDNAYVRRKQGAIVDGVDATPEEVRQFFVKHKDELPDIKEEIELSHILFYPEIEAENEQKIVDQLNQIKKEIEEGASFATKAILYSKDPGSASNGGLISKVIRGRMVPEFDAVIFNLDEGQISEPFKTEFGYHIAMLEKRRGQEVDVRHILISLIPTKEEVKKSLEKLDSIRILINEEKLTFKEAAFRFSEDKYTKFNSGSLMSEQTGEDRFEKASLPMKEMLAVAGLEDGQLSNVFEDEFKGKTALRLIKVNRLIPAHKINYETDFSRLKRITANNKEQEVLISWIKSQVSDSFIKIGKEYNHCTKSIDWLPDLE